MIFLYLLFILFILFTIIENMNYTLPKCLNTLCIEKGFYKIKDVGDIRTLYWKNSIGRKQQSINIINIFLPNVISNIVVDFSNGSPYYNFQKDPSELIKCRIKLADINKEQRELPRLCCSCFEYRCNSVYEEIVNISQPTKN